MTLFIKKMADPDSIAVVERELDTLRIRYHTVKRGVVKLRMKLAEKKRRELEAGLLSHGLELVGEKQSILVEKIRSIIEEFADNIEDLPKTKYSDYISKKLNNEYAYGYISILFSKIHGTTIERAIISLKIERVKKLLIHSRLNVTQIARKLNYTRVTYLTDQFKQITGCTALQFRKQNKR